MKYRLLGGTNDGLREMPNAPPRLVLHRLVSSRELDKTLRYPVSAKVPDDNETYIRQTWRNGLALTDVYVLEAAQRSMQATLDRYAKEAGL